jgi:hypothetical protein
MYKLIFERKIEPFLRMEFIFDLFSKSEKSLSVQSDTKMGLVSYYS